MLQSSCTPSMPFTSANGSSTSTAAQRSESGISITTLMGGSTGARCCASSASCRGNTLEWHPSRSLAGYADDCVHALITCECRCKTGDLLHGQTLVITVSYGSSRVLAGLSSSAACALACCVNDTAFDGQKDRTARPAQLQRQLGP